MTIPTREIERSVCDRYSNAAGGRQPELCCPVDYDDRYLRVIPEEIIERDYGCGDPSRHVRRGETVLDLGSGGGKICYIASQVVGPEGRVIGVDMNDEMLGLARSHRQAIGDRLGYHNVDFRKGRIQDLALDVERLEQRLAERPASTPAELEALEAWKTRECRERPLIADDSIDVIVSNCVLNLVAMPDRERLFAEMERVLKRGGRAVISDIVADEDVPDALQADPELWTGCLSGAYREDRFLDAFERAGFYGTRVLERSTQPWQTIEGIGFRSVTIEAWKGNPRPAVDRRDTHRSDTPRCGPAKDSCC